MAKATEASRHGFELHIDEQPDGQWRWSLHDENGEVAHGLRGSHASGYDGARRWLRNNLPDHEPESEQLPLPPPKQKPKSKPPPRTGAPGPGTAQLISILEDRARFSEEEVIRLRERAETLETEAKRLWAAADVLKDPDADQS